MSSVRTMKHRLSAVSRLWEKQDYDAALAEVEGLLEAWPGNARLHILWASLVQLQEDPKHSLDEVRQALQQAVELDKDSPAGPIELGHFLDAVDDNPQAAAKSYAEGASLARQQLIEALIGQARGLLQLGRREDSFRCLLELLHLMRNEPGSHGKKSSNRSPRVIFGTPTDQPYAIQLKGPFADQVEDLLSELVASRSA